MNTILDLIKWIMILITFALAWGFAYSFYQAWKHFHPLFQLEKEKAKKIPTLRDALTHERWQSMLKKFALGTPESMRIAIIEADALVDTTLKGMDIGGPPCRPAVQPGNGRYKEHEQGLASASPAERPSTPGSSFLPTTRRLR